MEADALLRRAVLALGVATLGAGALAQLLGHPALAEILWSAIAVVVAIRLVAITAQRLRSGRIAVDVVALLALLGSLALGEALTGAVIGVMVATGDALEEYAQRRARRELTQLLSMAPKLAHRLAGGAIETVPVDEVGVGEELLVKPGEVVPVDGVALEAGVLDESMLTGEARPVEQAPGATVRSGSVNAGGAFRIRAGAEARDSAYAGIVRLVEAAGVERAPLVRLADRYALVFIPVVLVLAAGAWAFSGDPVRALAVLVVATPCPLVLAAPVAVVSGVARAARLGVVFKDVAALEALAGARTVLFDKTGTLTAGRPRVVDVVVAPGWDASEALRLAASVEQASPHVLAGALVAEATSRGLALTTPASVAETPGAGVGGQVDGCRVSVGSTAALVPAGVPPWLAAASRRAGREGSSTVAVLVDGEPVGLVLLVDEVRTDTPRALRALRRAGVERVVMVSGDRVEVAEPIGMALGVDQVYADRSPAEKVSVVRAEATDRPGVTVMVGDGVNDAPALATADLGVAIGGRGATISSEAADVVLLADRLDRLAVGVSVAQRATRIARQSVLGGMGLSFLGMGLAAAGLLAPVAGAVVQEVIDVLAIANALRVLRRPRSERAPNEVPEAWIEHLALAHGPLRLVLEDMRRAADGLDRCPPGDALATLREVAGQVRDEIIAHERVDEAVIYPGVARRLAGDDPLASMSRTHQEIFRLAGQLDRLATGSGPDGLDSADRSEVRRLLYSLDAILRLHFAQEEELLLALTPTVGGAAGGADPARSGAPPEGQRRDVLRRHPTG